MSQGVRMASGPGTADRAPSRFPPPSVAASPARGLRPFESLIESLIELQRSADRIGRLARDMMIRLNALTELERSLP